MEQLITSPQNPKIKQLLLLQQKSSERRRAGLFVVEGRRELAHCIAAGYEVEALFYIDEFPIDELGLMNDEYRQHPSSITPHSSLLPPQSPPVGGLRGANLFKVSPAVYERIAYRGSTEGVIAIVRERKCTLSDLVLPADALIVVLEGVEKPGNLGAVLRSADAAAADAVVICDPLTDLYNPNLIRSSIGACFTVPTVACTTEECIAFLKAKGIHILTAQLQDSDAYYDRDMRSATAIVLVR